MNVMIYVRDDLVEGIKRVAEESKKSVSAYLVGLHLDRKKVMFQGVKDTVEEVQKEHDFKTEGSSSDRLREKLRTSVPEKPDSSDVKKDLTSEDKKLIADAQKRLDEARKRNGVKGNSWFGGSYSKDKQLGKNAKKA